MAAGTGLAGPYSLGRRLGHVSAAFVLLYLACVITETGQRLDQAIMQGAAALSSPEWADRILGAVSAAGVTIAAVVIAVATAPRCGWAVAAIATVAAGATLAATEVLKAALTRPAFLG